MSLNRDIVTNGMPDDETISVSYTHLRAHETRGNLVCRLLLEKKKKQVKEAHISIHRTTRCVVYFFFNDTATTEIYT